MLKYPDGGNDVVVRDDKDLGAWEAPVLALDLTAFQLHFLFSSIITDKRGAIAIEDHGEGAFSFGGCAACENLTFNTARAGVTAASEGKGQIFVAKDDHLGIIMRGRDSTRNDFDARDA